VFTNVSLKLLQLPTPPGRTGKRYATSAVVELEYVALRSGRFNLRIKEVDVVIALCLWSVSPFPV